MAKKKGRPKVTLSSASVKTLERLLARRKREIASLEKRRATLLARLAEVERKLAALQGVPSAAGAKPVGRARKVKKVKKVVRRRKRRGASLATVIRQVLDAASGPLKAADITEKVLAAGYRTKAKNFRQIVLSTLSRHPDAARVGTGVYVLKGREESAAAAKESNSAGGTGKAKSTGKKRKGKKVKRSKKKKATS